MNDTQFTLPRSQMVVEIAAHVSLTSDRIGKETLDTRVMDAIGRVPRHEFVPLELRGFAYVNAPLPIGYGKTISQPYINALMTDLLEVGPAHRVLEVGTGYGYQAAVLAELAREVFTIEIIDELAEGASRRLSGLSYDNIEMAVGDGSRGWPKYAPFDRILVTAAPDLVPPALIAQLKPGGRMVIPAGLEESQQLMIVDKADDGKVTIREVLPVRFSELHTDDSF